MMHGRKNIKVILNIRIPKKKTEKSIDQLTIKYRRPNSVHGVRNLSYFGTKFYLQTGYVFFFIFH